jgi:hypothetical protein
MKSTTGMVHGQSSLCLYYSEGSLPLEFVTTVPEDIMMASMWQQCSHRTGMNTGS